MGNVVFVGCPGADRTVGDDRRLMGAIVCVITKSAILISAQFNISPHYSFMVQIKSPSRLQVRSAANVLVYCEVVQSAIIATAWLLVL